MNGRAAKQQGPIGWLAGRLHLWRIGVFALLPLYVLSFAPVLWLEGRAVLPPATLKIYLPLILAANHGPDWIRRPLARCSGPGSLGFGSRLMEKQVQLWDATGGVIPMPSRESWLPAFPPRPAARRKNAQSRE